MEQEYIEKKIPSALPIYIAAGVFLAGALILPVYSLWGLIVTAALSGAAYIVASKKIPPRVVKVAAPERAYKTGVEDADALLRDLAAGMKTLAQLDDRIADEELSEAIRRMVKAGRSIMKVIEDKPEKSRDVRRFAAYYLPTAVKVLDTYARLDESGAQGHVASGLRDDVHKNARTIAAAFEAQLDALFSDEALDVSSDLDVLDAITKSEGIEARTSGSTDATPHLQL